MSQLAPSDPQLGPFWSLGLNVRRPRFSHQGPVALECRACHINEVLIIILIIVVCFPMNKWWWNRDSQVIVLTVLQITAGGTTNRGVSIVNLHFTLMWLRMKGFPFLYSTIYFFSVCANEDGRAFLFLLQQLRKRWLSIMCVDREKNAFINIFQWHSGM